MTTSDSNPRVCRVCGKAWPIPSLAKFCAAKDDLPHEVK